jgi:NTP pyrophosphatase (non-canonical NTP hydrolase)
MCERYLTRDRAPDGSDPQVCEECRERTNMFLPAQIKLGPGIPLAQIRGPLTEPLDVEVLALLNEECGEIAQRISKVFRWGWHADFAGTTQDDKLHSELGDLVAAIVVAVENGIVDLDQVLRAANAKLQKFREDAAGPHQRLTVASAPQCDVEMFIPLIDAAP